jgi:hypothetical protein
MISAHFPRKFLWTKNFAQQSDLYRGRAELEVRSAGVGLDARVPLTADPKWFRPTVVGKGRLFKIDFNMVTWILFDEGKNRVWLFTSRG